MSIEVEDLCKDYPRRARQLTNVSHGRWTSLWGKPAVVPALRSVNFKIMEGEIVGYLGVNGSGKSTTIKILTGIIRPTSGRVSVAGVVPWRDRVKNSLNVGVVFGHRSQLWADLPLRDSLEFIGKLYGLPRVERIQQVDKFVELLELTSFIDQPARQLSLGQRMRGDLAAAMLPNPRVLLLDEPTVGLDIFAKSVLRTFVKQLNVEVGTTVLLTTHDMDDVEELCSRIIIVDKGKVIHDGNANSLQQSIDAQEVHVVLAPGGEWREEFMQGLAGVNGVAYERKGQGLRIMVRANKTGILGDILAKVVQDHDVDTLVLGTPDLETSLLNFYRSRDRKLGG